MNKQPRPKFSLKNYCFLRVLRFMNILRICNAGFTVEQICDAFNISRATLMRDLKDLRRIGIPIHSYKGGGLELRDKHFINSKSPEYFYNRLTDMEKNVWKQFTN